MSDQTTALALPTQRIGEALATRLGAAFDAEVYADRLGTADEAEAYRALGAAVADLTNGWRPPPRVIETPEELEALPRGVIVESKSGTIAARYDQTRGVCFGDARSFPWTDLVLPVTVLREAVSDRG